MRKTVLLAILFVVVLVAAYVGVSIMIRLARASVAEGRGVAFIGKLYAEYAIVGQNCQGEDTDNDSYVSCDFRIKNAAADERVVHLQCPTMWKSFLGDSCKESRIIVTQ